MAQMDLSSWKVVYFLTLISAGDHLISRKLSHGNLSFINQTLTPNLQNFYLTGKSKLVTAPTDDCMTDSWLQYCCTDCGAILSARACTRQVPAEARVRSKLGDACRDALHANKAQTEQQNEVSRASAAFFPGSKSYLLTKVGIFPPIFPET